MKNALYKLTYNKKRGELSLNKYIYLVYLSFKKLIMYKSEIWLGIFSSVVTLSIQIYLWKRLYATNPAYLGVSLEDMITYFILSSGLSVCLLSPDMLEELTEDVRGGQIANHLSKPYRYQLTILSRSLGRVFFNLLFVVLPMFIIAVLLFGFTFPQNFSSLILAIFIVANSYIIYFTINFIAGLSSFWIMDLHGAIPLLLDNIIRILSGALIPIWIFPKWLYNLTYFLPIRLGFDLPLSIYIGNADSKYIIHGLVLQFIWLVILLTVSSIIWKKGIRKLVIQGG